MKIRRFSKVVSIFVALTMLMSMSTGVMASGVNVENDLVEVAAYEEDLGDGLVMRKILSLPKNEIESNGMQRVGSGFSGTRTAYVTHRLYKTGSSLPQAEISAQATFFSTFSVNCCYVQSKSYSIVKEGKFPFYLYSNISEYVNDNVYGDVNYAKYSVGYTLSNFTHNISETMWVKCDANGNTSNNTASYSLQLEENQVSINGVTYTFG